MVLGGHYSLLFVNGVLFLPEFEITMKIEKKNATTSFNNFLFKFLKKLSGHDHEFKINF